MRDKLKKIYWYIYRSIIKPKIPVNANGKVMVNLGCGINSGKQFINIDTLKLPNIHHVTDIENLFMFGDNCVDLIYASHVVEHIERNNLKKVLCEWFRVLKPGGILRLSVPDFDKLLEVYNESNHDVNSIVSQLMGSNGHYHDHHSIWNYKFAKQLLIEIGFANINQVDQSFASCYDFHDKSETLMKINNKEILISLNIEATKI